MSSSGENKKSKKDDTDKNKNKKDKDKNSKKADDSDPSHADKPQTFLDSNPRGTHGAFPKGGPDMDVEQIKQLGNSLKNMHNNLIDLLDQKVAQGSPFSYYRTQSVEIKVVFLRIADIDTISQQFEAEVYVQARWPEIRYKGFTEEELKGVEFYDCWDPQLKILNAIGRVESESTSMVLRYEPDSVYPVLTYLWHVRGLFREKLELEHFPFDVQELSIVLSSTRSTREVELVPDQLRHSSVSPTALQNNQDWTSYVHVDFTRDVSTVESLGTSRHTVLLASSRVKRKTGYYWWNVALILLIILCLSLNILAIDPTGNDRLGFLVTLFLTCVAFKLIIKTTLPAISYLTYLDIYVIFALIYLAMQMWVAATLSHLAKYRARDKVLLYDEVAQSILIGLLVLFHALFITYIQCTAMAKRRDMALRDHELKKEKIRNRKKAGDNANANAPQNTMAAGKRGPGSPPRRV